jgi:hypothetical protein
MARPESTFTISRSISSSARARREEPTRVALNSCSSAPRAQRLLYPRGALEHARLSEKLGDTKKSGGSYAFVAAIWQNTDSPLLRNAVQEAHDASSGLIPTALAASDKR